MNSDLIERLRSAATAASGWDPTDNAPYTEWSDLLDEAADALMTCWQPVLAEEAQEHIAVGVHTGLRKGSEAPSSGPLWHAIHDSSDGAWADAVSYCVWGMKHMGFAVCRRAVEPTLDPDFTEAH